MTDKRRTWRTLTEELEELERTDPAVRRAREKWDEFVFDGGRSVILRRRCVRALCDFFGRCRK